MIKLWTRTIKWIYSSILCCPIWKATIFSEAVTSKMKHHAIQHYTLNSFCMTIILIWWSGPPLTWSIPYCTCVGHRARSVPRMYRVQLTKWFQRCNQKGHQKPHQTISDQVCGNHERPCYRYFRTTGSLHKILSSIKCGWLIARRATSLFYFFFVVSMRKDFEGPAAMSTEICSWSLCTNLSWTEATLMRTCGVSARTDFAYLNFAGCIRIAVVRAIYEICTSLAAWPFDLIEDFTV